MIWLLKGKLGWHMMTSSNGNISRVTGLCEGNSPVTGVFPSQRPVTRSFGDFFDRRLNKRLSKQSWDWWFKTPSWPLCRYCNELDRYLCPGSARLCLGMMTSQCNMWYSDHDCARHLYHQSRQQLMLRKHVSNETITPIFHSAIVAKDGHF